MSSLWILCAQMSCEGITPILVFCLRGLSFGFLKMWLNVCGSDLPGDVKCLGWFYTVHRKPWMCPSHAFLVFSFIVSCAVQSATAPTADWSGCFPCVGTLRFISGILLYIVVYLLTPSKVCFWNWPPGVQLIWLADSFTFISRNIRQLSTW